MKIFFIVIILLDIVSPVYSACAIDTATMCSGEIESGQNVFLNKNELFITPFLKARYILLPNLKFDFVELILNTYSGYFKVCIKDIKTGSRYP